MTLKRVLPIFLAALTLFSPCVRGDDTNTTAAPAVEKQNDKDSPNDTDLRPVVSELITDSILFGFVGELSGLLDKEKDAALIETISRQTSNAEVRKRITAIIMPVARDFFDKDGAQHAHAFIGSPEGKKFILYLTRDALGADGKPTRREAYFTAAEIETITKFFSTQAAKQILVVQIALRDEKLHAAIEAAAYQPLELPAGFLAITIPDVLTKIADKKIPESLTGDPLYSPVIDSINQTAAIHAHYMEAALRAALFVKINPEVLISPKKIKENIQTVTRFQGEIAAIHKALDETIAARVRTLDVLTGEGIVQHALINQSTKALARVTGDMMGEVHAYERIIPYYLAVLNLANENQGHARLAGGKLVFKKAAEEARYQDLLLKIKQESSH